MFRTQKHQDFVSDPIIKYKSVETIPGITIVSGGHLKEAGFGSAISVLNQFLLLKQNEKLFTDWLRSVAGVNANYASMCYHGLREWYDIWGKEYGYKVVPTPPPPVVMRRQKSLTPTPRIPYEQTSIFVDFFAPHDRSCKAVNISANSMMDLSRGESWQRLNNNETKRLSMPKCLNALQDKNINFLNFPPTANNAGGPSARSLSSRSSHSRSMTPEQSVQRLNNNFRASLERNEKKVGSPSKPFIASVKEFIRGGSGKDRKTSFESSTMSIDSMEESRGRNETSDEEHIHKDGNQKKEPHMAVGKDQMDGKVKPLQKTPTFILDSEPRTSSERDPEDDAFHSLENEKKDKIEDENEDEYDDEGQKERETTSQSKKAETNSENKERNRLSTSTPTSDGSKMSNGFKNVRYADIDEFDDRQDIRNIKPSYERARPSKDTKENNLTTSLNSKVRTPEAKNLTSCLSKSAASSVSTPNLNDIPRQGLSSSTGRKSALKDSRNTSKSTIHLRANQPSANKNLKPSLVKNNLTPRSNSTMERNSLNSKPGTITERNVTILKRSTTSIGENNSRSSEVKYTRNQTQNSATRLTRRPKMSNQDSGVFMNSKRFSSSKGNATTDSDLDSTTLSGSVASYQFLSKSVNNLNTSNGCESSTNFAIGNSANEGLEGHGSTDWIERDELECITNKRRNVRLFCDLLSSEMEQLPFDKIRSVKTKILQLVYSEIEKHETETNSQS